MSSGKVYLVGAGPGDADLITVKGLRLLQRADVVIYDRLIPEALLTEVRADAELIYAGKEPTRHRLSQDKINELLITHALAGKMVVRLKGGDPFVFGRGGEEALVCYAAGVPFEIVPGVSSVFAVPAYAGIPLTHRHISCSFTVIAGHEAPNKALSQVQYEAIAQMGGTLVILMGVKNLQSIVKRLIQAGLNPETPAAIIEWGTTAQQRVITAEVHELPHQAQLANIQPPATTIIGEVVTLRDEGMRWFDEQLLSTLQQYGGV
ncbi:MAG: uroporphyrinogen-III C-methyltransferase [Chloroflexi bacterium]|nr:MAG: uroporphyrinogen-III C-methyltransferase [Chloroflexota bacterium]